MPKCGPPSLRPRCVDFVPVGARWRVLIAEGTRSPNTQAPLSDTSFVYQLDQITQDVIRSIMDAQTQFLPGQPIAVARASEKIGLPLPDGSPGGSRADLLLSVGCVGAMCT